MIKTKWTLANQFEYKTTLYYRRIRNFFRAIKRFFYWGWKLRNNYDWDYSYIYQVLHLKLRRMYDDMTKRNITFGTDKNSSNMKRLLEACELSKRLYETNYRFKNSHEERNDKERLFYLMNKYIQHWWD